MACSPMISARCRRLSSGGEGVLNVREPKVRVGYLVAVERHLLFVDEREDDRAGGRVDVGNVCGGAVVEVSVFGVGDGAADLYLVARVQRVRAARDGERVSAELPALRDRTIAVHQRGNARKRIHSIFIKLRLPDTRTRPPTRPRRNQVPEVALILSPRATSFAFHRFLGRRCFRGQCSWRAVRTDLPDTN